MGLNSQPIGSPDTIEHQNPVYDTDENGTVDQMDEAAIHNLITDDYSAITHDHTGETINPAVTQTDELSGTYPGKVRATSADRVVASIDPSGTTTPVQDAINAINTNGNGSGEVRLPAKNVDEAGALTDMGGIIVRGRGMGSSQITFTDPTVPGVHPTAGLDLNKGGFVDVQLDGGDRLNRTVTEPFFDNDASLFAVVMDCVNLTNWVREFDFLDGDVFSSYWPFIMSNPTEEIMVHGDPAPSPGLQVGTWYVSPDAKVSNVPANASRPALFNFTETTRLQILNVNAGFQTGRLVNVEVGSTGDQTGILGFGTNHINYETEQTTPEMAWLGPNKHRVEIGPINFGGTGTVDRLVNVAGGGENFLGYMRRSAGVTLNNNYIEVTANTLGASPTVTLCDSALVSNSTGLTLNQPVSCLGDLTTVS